jgi:hypothetical protein
MDQPTDSGSPARRCEWCSAIATEDAVSCAGCGAALLRAEAADDEPYYPGVTDVHPHLKAAAARQLQVPQRQSATAMAGASVFRFASQAGPGGALIGLGAVAAIAAVEWMGASRKTGPESGVAFIDSISSASRPPDRDLKAVLAQLDGKWHEGVPQSSAPIPEDQIPDPPERPLPRQTDPAV